MSDITITTTAPSAISVSAIVNNAVSVSVATAETVAVSIKTGNEIADLIITECASLSAQTAAFAAGSRIVIRTDLL